MSRFTLITDKALQLVEQVGVNVKHIVPSAGKLMQTGMALGAAKTGGRVAVAFVRRNPVIAVTAALGMGVLAYAASRKAKQQDAATPIEGRSKRVEARRVSGGARRSGTATRNSRGTTTTTSIDE
ncbi:MAG TPA: hypothetical protein VK325_02485 [Pseudoxanthomonas sp.]|nr:hypothetical protein [Pseudoxanthomonas sp.]